MQRPRGMNSCSGIGKAVLVQVSMQNGGKEENPGERKLEWLAGESPVYLAKQLLYYPTGMEELKF